MRSSELLSKEWCDLVFENRNREYGAYRLRAQAGMRYRRAMAMVFGFFAAMTLIGVGLALYTQYIIKKEMKAAEEAFVELHKSDLKDGYKVKFVATARMAPPTRMAPGATQSAFKIVDGVPPLKSFGMDGPIVYDPEQDAITTPIIDTTSLHDTSLPIAKQKIVPTDVVSQMPTFPGGPRAFMLWLNENISYPQRCINSKKQGVVTLSFIVGTDGYPIDFEVKNAFDTQIYSISLGALKRMPRWKPGTDDEGKVVPVRISVSVEFKI